MERRFSDLSSMWLGELEKAIAAAFEEAADLRAFLVLDEVDSLLRDRRAAQQSWEVTQVNEMLTRMERHPCPFACTTNAPELLDAAAARRFLFKVRFLPMTAQQIAKAYRRAFGAEAPAFVLRLDGSDAGRFRDRREEGRRPRRERSEGPRKVAGSRGAGEARRRPTKDRLLICKPRRFAALKEMPRMTGVSRSHRFTARSQPAVDSTFPLFYTIGH